MRPRRRGWFLFLAFLCLVALNIAKLFPVSVSEGDSLLALGEPPEIEPGSIDADAKLAALLTVRLLFPGLSTLTFTDELSRAVASVLRADMTASIQSQMRLPDVVTSESVLMFGGAEVPDEGLGAFQECFLGDIGLCVDTKLTFFSLFLAATFMVRVQSTSESVLFHAVFDHLVEVSRKALEQRLSGGLLADKLGIQATLLDDILVSERRETGGAAATLKDLSMPVPVESIITSLSSNTTSDSGSQTAILLQLKFSMLPMSDGAVPFLLNVILEWAARASAEFGVDARESEWTNESNSLNRVSYTFGALFVSMMDGPAELDAFVENLVADANMQFQKNALALLPLWSFDAGLDEVDTRSLLIRGESGSETPFPESAPGDETEETGDRREGPSLGAIVGIVVGGVTGLLLCTCFLLYHTRAKRRKAVQVGIPAAEREPVPDFEIEPSVVSLAVDPKEVEVVDILGQGGYSVVYLACWRGSMVALKQLKTGLDSAEIPSEEVSERQSDHVDALFAREIEAMRDLRHPNIVALYGCIREPERRAALVLEYVSGGSLFSHLHLHGREGAAAHCALSCRQSTAVRLQTLWGIAKGCAYLHDFGRIAHNDLKSMNVMISEQEHGPKIADFGLSMRVDEQGRIGQGAHVGGCAAVVNDRRAGAGCTPAYAAPEQLRQERDISGGIWSDVFSFGVLMVETLHGVLPFPCATARSVYELHTAAQRAGASSLLSTTPVPEVVSSALGENGNCTRENACACVRLLRCVCAGAGVGNTCSSLVHANKEFCVTDEAFHLWHEQFSALAAHCTAFDADRRPRMPDVVDALERLVHMLPCAPMRSLLTLPV
ncbi:putative serine/threonine-protein kinase drkA [Porphyridium purpureum]|uniref:Putative serine/threonine-protein kinase drkA n=1 Tax=Porphyridium purpureum TaxID=35688 RepID=A0A5J4YSV3_PORPP|nr:putative serine/threonine-protein kinase drkA [Porphyridium purpureum]|eukprot:POR2795..scf227_4